jgi:HSP20 family protein
MAERRSFFERLTGSVRREVGADDAGDAVEVVEMRDDDRAGAASSESRERPSEPSRTSQTGDQEGQLTVDVYQTPEFIVVKSTIAGVKPDDLDVSITNDMVTIRGTRRHDEEVREDDYFYRECYWGSFSRSIILPVDIVSEKSEASLKDGILTIRIPKADALLTKKVKVRGF